MKSRVFLSRSSKDKADVIRLANDHFKVKKDNMKVHFDLEQFKISFWSINSDGEIQWENNMSPDSRIPIILNE